MCSGASVANTLLAAIVLLRFFPRPAALETLSLESTHGYFQHRTDTYSDLLECVVHHPMHSSPRMEKIWVSRECSATWHSVFERTSVCCPAPWCSMMASAAWQMIVGSACAHNRQYHGPQGATATQPRTINTQKNTRTRLVNEVAAATARRL